MFPVSVTAQAKWVIAGCTLAFVAFFSAYTTWQIMDGKLHKQQAEHQQAIIDEQLKYEEKVREDAIHMQFTAEAYQANAAQLNKRINKLVQDKQRQEKPLPLDCVVDADGVQWMEEARKAALSSAGQ
jgi:hypothetical protein